MDPLLAAASPPPEQGSDILTVHRSRGDALPLRVPYMTSNTDDLRIDAGSEIALGDLIMVSDCNAAAVFQTTNSDTGSTGILRHVTGSGTPGNASANLGRRYNGDAQIHRVSTVTYYVGRSQNQSGTSSLWRVTGTGTPVEMVEGIDTMQVQYGVDSDGDRVIDRYLPASGVTDFSQVMSVQLTVVLVSVEDGLTRTTTSYELNGTIVTPSDRRARRVFSTTVALRNKTL